MMKVLVTAAVHESLIAGLADKGYEVVYQHSISYDEVLEIIPSFTGLVITTRIKVDQAIIDRAKKLKWIGRLGSGMELVDVNYAEAKGIKCISSPEGNRNAVAEHALGLLLALRNNILKSHNDIKEGKWLRNENRGLELSGRTVGIIGYGNTGGAFSKLLQPFDCRILVYDIVQKEIKDPLAKQVSLDELMLESDVISFHVPLTDFTRGMANDEFFNNLGKKPFVLNTCRGKVMQTASLITALKEGKISGAGLDVLENEHLTTYSSEETDQLKWLSAQPNVIITPHIAGYSYEAFYKMAEVLLDKLGE